ncbi:hypothetical protein SeLEV6574_g03167 [Synchytrium endobioticum]|uniref:Uncharacterized protein n=1 Tax=Synchytrium endobioticum TaxID=286115 RepID=A0A507D571_9FUNG|nr:hypothetical protein SeLEV6574_g03167 [Synchytrium endobioticum]
MANMMVSKVLSAPVPKDLYVDVAGAPDDAVDVPQQESDVPQQIPTLAHSVIFEIEELPLSPESCQPEWKEDNIPGYDPHRFAAKPKEDPGCSFCPCAIL